MDEKIFVAGHRGLAGSAIVRALKQSGHRNLVLRTRAELDLCDTERVTRFMESERPEARFGQGEDPAVRCRVAGRIFLMSRRHSRNILIG